MADPAFYPHPVTYVERRDTHISTVFLTGDWVYKLKKSVNFGFLDFSDLSKRKHYCDQEVRLNQRLSHGIYQGTVAIRLDPDGRIHSEESGKSGEIIEYAVKMRQLPDADSLLRRIQDNKIAAEQMEDLGRFLVRFYRNAAADPDLYDFARPEAISANTDDNFAQTEAFARSVLDEEKWTFTRHASRLFLKHHADFFHRRIEAGHICDGHGDLRPDHIYLSDSNGIQIIDCIEFNDRFRYGDVAVDLAFLHMDLIHMGALQWSLPAVAAYVSAAQDAEIYRLLDFYACYRAMVRVKVDCLRLAQVEQGERDRLEHRVRSYLDQAYRHAVHFNRPVLWVVFGLPASGKSTVAERISELLKAEHLQTDQVRKHTADVSGQPEKVTAYGDGLYRGQLRQQVYAHLLGKAQDLIKSGRSVILDGTFSHLKWRREAMRLADDLDTGLVFVECRADTTTLRQRLWDREQESGLSDARAQHLEDFIKEFEPPDELTTAHHVPINSERPIGPLVIDLMNQAYRLLCAQTDELVRNRS